MFFYDPGLLVGILVTFKSRSQDNKTDWVNIYVVKYTTCYDLNQTINKKNYEHKYLFVTDTKQIITYRWCLTITVLYNYISQDIKPIIYDICQAGTDL